MYLFKYFEPERLDVIKNGCIRLTQPIDFNDPFEFRPVVSMISTQEEIEVIIDKKIEEELSNLPKDLSSKLSKNDLETSIRKFLVENQNTMDLFLNVVAKQSGKIMYQKSNELIGVLCLTEENDNLLMWSHYADSHKGFCIKFDASHKFFNRTRNEKDDFYHLRKIEYLKKRPNHIMSKMSSVDLLLQKSDIWAYEKEWRFCGVLNDSERQIKGEHLDIHLFEFSKDIIQEVILGVNASKDFEQEMKSIISQTPDLSHVKLSKAKISDEYYCLEFNELPTTISTNRDT